MTKVNLLVALRDFTREATKDLILPTAQQARSPNYEERPAAVFMTRLPDEKSPFKLVPYILHQVVTSEDVFQPGSQISSTVVVRSIFTVYDSDAEHGGLTLLELMERFRIGVLEQVVLNKQFRLDLTDGLQCMVYTNDTAPYFAGEIISTWEMPPVRREINYGVHMRGPGPICREEGLVHGSYETK